MSRATCKTPERLTSANQPRREEVQPAQGRGRAGGGSARAGKHRSVLVLSVKAEPNDDEAGSGEKSGDCVHGSLSSNEVVKARSNASHNISSNRNEAKGHGEDLAEGAHSALHLGGLGAAGLSGASPKIATTANGLNLKRSCIVAVVVIGRYPTAISAREATRRGKKPDSASLGNRLMRKVLRAFEWINAINSSALQASVFTSAARRKLNLATFAARKALEGWAFEFHSSRLGEVAFRRKQLLQRLPQRVPRLFGFAARQVTDRRLGAAALLCNHSLTKATFLER